VAVECLWSKVKILVARDRPCFTQALRETTARRDSQIIFSRFPASIVV
jgi:hypothetical protein